MTAVAPPAALPPARRTLRHRLRAVRAGARRGVVVEGTPLLGRGVVLDVAAGARVVLGDGCVLLDGCRIHARGAEVRIGAGALLGERCAILAHERVTVGPRSMLGDGVVLVDFAHAHEDVDRPVRHQPLETAPVEIGNGARIGPGAVLERGARVAPGGTVPAHAVTGPERRP
jgi:acetyltransferase-like isoleucine patch superfamily enzyme